MKKYLIFTSILLAASLQDAFASSTPTTDDNEELECPCCRRECVSMSQEKSSIDLEYYPYLSCEDLKVFFDSEIHSEKTLHSYEELMGTLKYYNEVPIEGGQDILMGQYILDRYYDKIQEIRDLNILYTVALKARDKSLDLYISTFLFNLVSLDWKRFRNYKYKLIPGMAIRLKSIIENEAIQSKDKNRITELLCITENFQFDTSILQGSVNNFLREEKRGIRFNLLASLIENRRIPLSEIIDTALIFLVGRSDHYQQAMLAATLVEKRDYIDRYWRIDERHRKILSRFLEITETEDRLKYKILHSPQSLQKKICYSENEKEGRKLPDIDIDKNPDLTDIYSAWISSHATLTRDNTYYIIYPPSFSTYLLQNHGKFLSIFFSTKGRLDTTNLRYLDLWNIIENSKNSDYSGYQDIPGDWRKILWDAYNDLPEMKNGEYLPDFDHGSQKDAHIRCTIQDKFNAWTGSRVIIQKGNYQRLFTPQFNIKRSIHSHGTFLDKFFDNDTRFERTNLDYNDLEKILRKDIPGTWKDNVIKYLLPKVIFKDPKIVTRSMDRLIPYLHAYPLDESMIISLITALKIEPLSVDQKYQIIEALGKNQSYLRYYESLEQKEKGKLFALTALIQREYLVLLGEEKERALSDGSLKSNDSSGHTTCEERSQTPSPKKPKKKKDKFSLKESSENPSIVNATNTPTPSLPLPRKKIQDQEKKAQNQERKKMYEEDLLSSALRKKAKQDFKKTARKAKKIEQEIALMSIEDLAATELRNQENENLLMMKEDPRSLRQERQIIAWLEQLSDPKWFTPLIDCQSNYAVNTDNH